MTGLLLIYLPDNSSDITTHIADITCYFSHSDITHKTVWVESALGDYSHLAKVSNHGNPGAGNQSWSNSFLVTDVPSADNAPNNQRRFNPNVHFDSPLVNQQLFTCGN